MPGRRRSQPASAGRPWSASLRTRRLPRQACRRHPRQGSFVCASERLSQADIEADGGVAGARVEREADIDADRAEIGIVTCADAGTDTRRHRGEVGPYRRVSAAGVDEGYGTPGCAYSLAKLKTAFDDARAAQWIQIGVARTGRLIGKAAHGAAATGVEQLVRRNAVELCIRNYPERGSRREHAAAGVAEIEIGAARGADDRKLIADVSDVEVGRQIERKAKATARIQHIVGSVEREAERDAEKPIGLAQTVAFDRR